MSKVIWNKQAIRKKSVCDIVSGTIFTWGDGARWFIRCQGQSYSLDTGFMSSLEDPDILDNYLEAKAIEIKGTK